MTLIVERFAPSPTGALHLGHAYSALTVWEAVQSVGGLFLLRMDDLDRNRCQPRYVDAIIDDLHWLGLSWPEPVLHQSTRAPSHVSVLQALKQRGLIYPCCCTRAEIEAAAGAPQEGAEMGPAYPGICRSLIAPIADKPYAMRLDMRKAVEFIGGADAVRALSFVELGQGPNGEHGTIALDPASLIERVGDVVLRRKDGAIAYHLAVVVDDAFQGVTHVTRANDLFTSTPIHRLLQALIGLPTPFYRHHPLIRDASGRRLAKRNGDMAISALRISGATPNDLRAAAGLTVIPPSWT